MHITDRTGIGIALRLCPTPLLPTVPTGTGTGTGTYNITDRTATGSGTGYRTPHAQRPAAYVYITQPDTSMQQQRRRHSAQAPRAAQLAVASVLAQYNTIQYNPIHCAAAQRSHVTAAPRLTASRVTHLREPAPRTHADAQSPTLYAQVYARVCAALASLPRASLSPRRCQWAHALAHALILHAHPARAWPPPSPHRDAYAGFL